MADPGTSCASLRLTTLNALFLDSQRELGGRDAELFLPSNEGIVLLGKNFLDPVIAIHKGGTSRLTAIGNGTALSSKSRNVINMRAMFECVPPISGKRKSDSMSARSASGTTQGTSTPNHHFALIFQQKSTEDNLNAHRSLTTSSCLCVGAAALLFVERSLIG